MISLLLLLKIIAALCFIVSWVFLYLAVRRMARRLERLKAHYDARITALAESLDNTGEADGPEEEAREARRKALEAERRFTEGITSILNFSVFPAGDIIAAAADLTGKKGE